MKGVNFIMKYLGEVDTIGEAWITFLKEINENGKVKEYSKNKIIKEESGLSISIKKAKLPDKIIDQYMVKEEYEWMENNFNNQGIVKELRNARSYASRLYNYLDKKNQIDWVINKLKDDVDTCSATITTFEPLTDEAYVPCISMLDFYVENSVLNLYVYARSLDWGGKAYANLAMLTKIMKDVSKEINIPVGGINLTVKLSRIYEKDNIKVEKILKDYQK